MKRVISLLLCGLMIFSLTACGGSNTPVNSGNNGVASGGIDEDKTDTPTDNTQSGDTDALNENNGEQQENSETELSSGSNILVAVFSLADEQYEVGVIEKGNTQIIAEIIAAETGADLFSIESTESYPTTYDGLLEKSREEESDPPQIAGTVENMADYDIVFIGYPIWWGDLPTIVRVFLESYDFSGKTVIPFCTHAGSGLSGTQRTIESLCDGATVEDGLAVRGSTAQNNYEETESTVKDWLDGLGLEHG